jgi:four helix bundle protein
MSNLKTENQNSNLKSNVRYRSYLFSLEIIKTIIDFPEKRLYWIFGDQLIRAATSIGANLIEAKSSSSKKDFIKFYEIALKSENETEYWLYLLGDSDLVEKVKINSLLKEVREIGRMIGSSLLTLKNKRI